MHLIVTSELYLVVKGQAHANNEKVESNSTLKFFLCRIDFKKHSSLHEMLIVKNAKPRYLQQSRVLYMCGYSGKKYDFVN